MKISVNWLRQFTDINLSVDELVKKIGAQLGAVEEVIDLGQKYQGIIVAKVVSCEKHPNADKLSVCKIDDGGKAQDVERDENGHVQVVCGAPNVRATLQVAWIPPGVAVPSTLDKDPFVLEARELRGVMSNGMIASAAELAIGDDHNGIVELDTPAEPGTYFASAYDLNDCIIDIENKMFTHRPDCFGILGVAREVAGIQQIPFHSPDWYSAHAAQGAKSKEQGAKKLQLEVENKAGDLVPRFMAVAMADVTMGPSPFIIQTYLARVGLKPINNIVDVTNYLMALTGQPLHAYDADKLRAMSKEQGALSLETRMSRKGDKLKLLGGKEIEFDDESTILITSNDVPVGIGGVMGGADTEVDENTKNIVLECANFDMYSIRRTSMKYGLFTDAVTRFNKGQSPLQNDVVLEEAVATMQYVSGARVASDVVDIQSNEQRAMSKEVEVTAEFVSARLGLELSTEDMARLLDNVEFGVQVHGDELAVTPPFWRTDIEIPEDVVEEIGRLYGYDHLPLDLPKRSIRPAQKDALLEFKTLLRELLSKAGANEVLTYSFVHGNLLDKVGQDKENAFELSNALSPDLQYYRLSLLPSLLASVHPNIKAGYGEFALFEINQTHGKDYVDEAGLPKEEYRLGFVIAADDKKAKASHKGAPYYQAKKYLDTVLASLGIDVVYEPAADYQPKQKISQAAIAPFEPDRTAIVRAKDGGIIGEIGEFRASVRRSLKLPQYVAGFELDVLQLLKYQSKENRYVALPRFPKVEQDISLKASKDIPYQPIFDELQAGLLELASSELKTELVPLDIYQKDTDKHFTFRLTAAHFGKTLKAAEVNELLDKLAERAKAKFGTERI